MDEVPESISRSQSSYPIRKETDMGSVGGRGSAVELWMELEICQRINKVANNNHLQITLECNGILSNLFNCGGDSTKSSHSSFLC